MLTSRPVWSPTSWSLGDQVTRDKSTVVMALNPTVCFVAGFGDDADVSADYPTFDGFSEGEEDSEDFLGPRARRGDKPPEVSPDAQWILGLATAGDTCMIMVWKNPVERVDDCGVFDVEVCAIEVDSREVMEVNNCGIGGSGDTEVEALGDSNVTRVALNLKQHDLRNSVTAGASESRFWWVVHWGALGPVDSSPTIPFPPRLSPETPGLGSPDFGGWYLRGTLGPTDHPHPLPPPVAISGTSGARESRFRWLVPGGTLGPTDHPHLLPPPVAISGTSGARESRFRWLVPGGTLGPLNPNPSLTSTMLPTCYQHFFDVYRSLTGNRQHVANI
uniref:Uncharacterized protein n=1 Tax=Timema shepardi TaxID=629360 RepID=A0A7R9G0S6_TIMSH|nr:unnamed protein product [Timema shepardi]